MRNRDGNKDAPAIRLTPDTCLWVRKTAYVCARRARLTREECEDCAGECVARLLDLADMGALLPGHLCKAWLYRCVDNYARNVARTVRRRRFHEIELYQTWEECDLRFAVRMADALPEPSVLRQELRMRLHVALKRLTPANRRLFLARCVEGETIAALAESGHRTPGAVREALCAVRARLRLLLARDGMTDAEIRDYLLLLSLL